MYIFLFQSNSNYGCFEWINLKIKGRAKVVLHEKRDKIKNLKAQLRRLSAIIGRYREESSSLKEYLFKLKGETIGLLEKTEVLKKEALDIKEKAVRLKAKHAMLRRKLAKHAAEALCY